MMAEVRAFFTEVYGLDAESIEANVMPTLTGDVP